jgi:hypothetical protein
MVMSVGFDILKFRGQFLCPSLDDRRHHQSTLEYIKTNSKDNITNELRKNEISFVPRHARAKYCNKSTNIKDSSCCKTKADIMAVAGLRCLHKPTWDH